MNSSTQGKVYSFWQLLKEHTIEVPIIQRDYAQGRKDKNEIRTEFLGALQKALEQSKPIKLDFIYGSKISGAFQPLDGQQRLTTLFLIHWYIAVKENKLTDDIKSVLQKFSYETRASSRQFCHELIKNDLAIEGSQSKVSDLIIDSSWFFLSWKKDPTIDAMLRAIDAIHTKFHDIDNLWEKLLSDSCLISFYYVELENFGLTDDLYIKMNARGKLLTPFENFKATFQKRIDDEGWDTGKKADELFSSKVDNKWTDLFWSHRKNDAIDTAFIRFISTAAMIQLALGKTDERLNKITNLNSRPDDVRIDHFTQEGYNYLYDCFEIYCQIYDENISVNFNFPLWQHAPVDNIFTALVYEGNDKSASYTQKVLFYAQTEYFRKTEGYNEEAFLDWMRVVRNIISRGDVDRSGKRPPIIRRSDTFIGVINLIEELSHGCDDIYNHLANHTIKSSFAKEQIEEEHLKAALIIDAKENKTVIFSTEDTNFCQGKIQFALYCIGYQNKDDEFNVEALQKIHNVFKEYLEEEKITNNFRRALLTIEVRGEYNYYNYWWSFSNIVSANKRCLIDKYGELEFYIYRTKDNTVYKNYLKSLLIQLIDKSLLDIISDFIAPDDMPNWKKRLIKEPQLLEEKCKSNYIAIPFDESCCYLLKGQRPRYIEQCEKIE